MQRNLINLVNILVIVSLALWTILPNNPGIHIGGINKDIDTSLGLDLVGGVQVLLEADLPEGTAITQESMATTVQIVENRVNAFGVSEAVVQQAGDRRIIVELPGESNPETAIATLKQTGQLEFVDFSMLTQQEVAAMQEAQTIIRTNVNQANVVPGAAVDTTNQTEQIFTTIMTGAEISEVGITTGITGGYQVAFELTPEGASIFREFTTANVGNILAIVLDKRIISAPSIENTIPDGRGVITGNFSVDGANALAIQLRYGSLPIPLKVVETRTINATLGQDSLQKSLVAGLIGFAIVILFMALYYRLPGLVAVIAILIYAIVAFALFRFIPITLTLAGIAGFLLSTGSALDANILIFERLREELRAGKNIRQSLDLAFQRAWPSIRDSNIATLITCAILFWFGSQFGATIVKGFSLTLALGVLVSVFTALFVTRTVLTLILERVQVKDHQRWFGI